MPTWSAEISEVLWAETSSPPPFRTTLMRSPTENWDRPAAASATSRVMPRSVMLDGFLSLGEAFSYTPVSTCPAYRSASGATTRSIVPEAE